MSDVLARYARTLVHDMNNVLASCQTYVYLTKQTTGSEGLSDATGASDAVLTTIGDATRQLQHLQILARNDYDDTQRTQLSDVVGRAVGWFQESDPSHFTFICDPEGDAIVYADPHRILKLLYSSLVLADSLTGQEMVEVEIGIPAVLDIRRDSCGETPHRCSGIVMDVRSVGFQGLRDPAFLDEINENTDETVSVSSPSAHQLQFVFAYPLALGLGAITDNLPSLDHSTEGSGLCILLVDNEETIRSVAGITLERLGHQTIIADGGSSGLSRFLDDPSRIDLLITDFSMPGMDGLTLIERVREVRPELPVIVMSGNEQAEISSTSRDCAYLQKPFAVETVARTIESVAPRS